MAREIVVNSDNGEVRAAILENGKLVDLFVERSVHPLSLIHILAMLDLAGVPLRAEVRTENDPIVIAGGPCGSNPEPIAAFFDLVVVGDGEEVIVEIMSEVARKKREGAERADIVNSLSEISGVYCPRHKNPVMYCLKKRHDKLSGKLGLIQIRHHSASDRCV